MSQVTLLKKIDGLVGPGLSRLFPATLKASAPLRDINHVLFIRPGGIGDAVLLIPTVTALKDFWPQAKIDILAEKRNAGVFSLCPKVENLFCYDMPRDWLNFCFKKYDLIVDTEQWHYLSALMARVLRTHWRCGFATNSRKRLFSHGVSYSHEDYEGLSFFHLLDVLGVSRPSAVFTPFLQVPEQDQGIADEILTQVQGPFVTLFPGASIPERRWSDEKFRQIAFFCREMAYGVVVVGGVQDRDNAQRILTGVSGLNLAGELSLAQSAAVLKRSALLVSTDSGVLHLAMGVGCKSVSLFGPGITAKWAPQGNNHSIVDLHVSCSPCTRFGTTPPCPYGAKCIQNISEEEVKNRIFSLLHQG